LRIIVLQTDLKLDGLEEVTLLGLVGVLKELLHVGAHTGCRTLSAIDSNASDASNKHTDCDLRHLDSLPIDKSYLMVRFVLVVS
jgi:hypothetical protein